MRAVSPGRTTVQDMDTDYGRLYVTMAEKFLDRADTRKLLPAHLSQKQSAAAKV